MKKKGFNRQTDMENGNENKKLILLCDWRNLDQISNINEMGKLMTITCLSE